MGASSFTVNQLKYGLRLDWIDKSPPLALTPTVIYHVKDINKMSLMRVHVSEMLDKGAIQLISDDLPGFYSRIFMIPKQGNKWRPVIDLSLLNNFISEITY